MQGNELRGILEKGLRENQKLDQMNDHMNGKGRETRICLVDLKEAFDKSKHIFMEKLRRNRCDKQKLLSTIQEQQIKVKTLHEES